MNKKLLSILIANAVVASGSAFADDDADNFQRLLNAQNEEQLDDVTFDSFFSAHGTVGTAFEYEDKVVKFANGYEEQETLKTAYLGKLYYHHKLTNMAFTYDLKTQERLKKGIANGSQVSFETESTWVHIFTAQRAFSLGNGFGTGVSYGVEYQDGAINASGGSDIGKTTTEHTFHIPLTYYNPKFGLGFYSHAEVLLTKVDQEAPWRYTQEDTAYSYLFKPYYRTGNWEVGVELFYQTKDTETNSGESEFWEFYYEPLVTYSFEDAGTLFLRARFGENETTHIAGPNMGEEYYKDIVKGTVGYEQAVGDDWLVKAEYEFTQDEETHNAQRDWQVDKEITGHKLYLQALYRF